MIGLPFPFYLQVQWDPRGDATWMQHGGEAEELNSGAVPIEPIGGHDSAAEIGVPGCEERVDSSPVLGKRQEKPAIVLRLLKTIEGGLDLVEGRLANSGALRIVPLDELSVVRRP